MTVKASFTGTNTVVFFASSDVVVGRACLQDETVVCEPERIQDTRKLEETNGSPEGTAEAALKLSALDA